jgi:hypothetical protein
MANSEIAERLGVSRPIVIAWRKRYTRKAHRPVADRPRRGRPQTVHRTRRAEILAATLTPPPEHLGVTHWSSRLLATEHGVSHSTVARVWVEHDIRPWQIETFKFSTDPQLAAIANVRDVVRAVPGPAGARDRAMRGREVPDQALDRLLVAIAGPPLGPLQRPTQPPAQDHPYMAGVVADPGQLGDDHRHPLQGPQVGVEPIRHRPSQQRLLDLGQLSSRQLGVRAGRAPAAQSIHAAFWKRACQTWALWRDTPSWWATSAWVWPWANSSAAWSRWTSRAARCWAGRGGGWSTSPDPHTPPAQTPTQPTKLNIEFSQLG